MSDVPARRETTALRKLIEPHVSEVNGVRCWWCSFCRGEWFDGEAEAHTDNCPYVAAEAELAAIERQREELRQDAEHLVTQIKTWRWLNWGKIAPWVCDCGHVHGEGVPAGEPCDECGMKKPCKEDRDEFYHAARLSGSPAATSEKPNDA